jgi:hypothetical protein
MRLDEIVQIAEKLAADTYHLRVDFFYSNEKIYVGELTFFHGGGFEKFTPPEYNELLGSWITLPTTKKAFIK